MDKMLLGSDRAVKFIATDDNDDPVEGATVSVAAVAPDGSETTPEVTPAGSTYKAIVNNTQAGIWRAIATAEAAHVGVGVDEWEVIDPRRI